jgi:hypothetical protein
MNCPHDYPIEDCVQTECVALMRDSVAVVVDLARCEHTMRARMGHGGSIAWCKRCGAFGEGGIEGVREWQAPGIAVHAKALDATGPLAGALDIGAERDSHEKNVK